MQQELPQLVDERRFRRREQEPVERDEYGRVRSRGPQAITYRVSNMEVAEMARGKDSHYSRNTAWIQPTRAGGWAWWCVREAHSERDWMSCAN